MSFGSHHSTWVCPLFLLLYDIWRLLNFFDCYTDILSSFKSEIELNDSPYGDYDYERLTSGSVNRDMHGMYSNLFFLFLRDCYLFSLVSNLRLASPIQKLDVFGLIIFISTFGCSSDLLITIPLIREYISASFGLTPWLQTVLICLSRGSLSLASYSSVGSGSESLPFPFSHEYNFFILIYIL